MDEQDRLYRLMADVRGTLADCPQITKIADTLAQAEGARAYHAQMTRCRLKRDWIDAIEEGLPFVERAVEEQRRFIRSNREVVRIDRAKRVSPESVRHLAQHSDMIDHVDENDDVIPKRLLIVEREENFAIYENRFLFTLVTLLCEFMERRNREYCEQNGAILFELTLQRRIQYRRRHLAAQVQYNEEITPDTERTSADQHEEIGRLRQRVNALAATQLMQLLRGTPMVTPPIIHTNVFKKNVNFQRSLILYEFLQNYRDSGCEYDALEKPPQDEAWQEVQRDLCLLIALQEHAVSTFAQDGVQAELARRYSQENERREEEARRIDDERAQALRAAVKQARQEAAAVCEAAAAERDRQLVALEEQVAALKAENERLRRECERQALAQQLELSAEQAQMAAFREEARQERLRLMQQVRQLEAKLAGQSHG